MKIIYRMYLHILYLYKFQMQFRCVYCKIKNEISKKLKKKKRVKNKKFIMMWRSQQLVWEFLCFIFYSLFQFLIMITMKTMNDDVDGHLCTVFYSYLFLYLMYL